MHNKVVARIHVGGLQATLEMLVGMEPERHAELFAFVDGFLVRGEAYGEGVVGIGALDAYRHVARDGTFLPVDGHVYLPGDNPAGFARGLQGERVNAGLVAATAASAPEKGTEHVFNIGAYDLVGTVQFYKGKTVLGFDRKIGPVFGEFLQRENKLESECLARFYPFPVELQGRPG